MHERGHSVLVVSAPLDVQRERVLARPGMSANKLEAILQRQLPDSEKRRRADFIVETGFDTFAEARAQLAECAKRPLDRRRGRRSAPQSTREKTASHPKGHAHAKDIQGVCG